MKVNFMEELIDLIATDGKPSDVTDKIKELLYAKAAEKVDDSRSEVATSMFAEPEETQEEE
tara:strand:- start:1095 stop:1277 length:183 start_codon:yes stop_codon:yes gene_type:complete